MFSDNLSLALLKLIEEKNISQEALAEACNLSPRFVGKVIRGHAVPTVTSLEKMCAALEVNPDELLLPKIEGDKLTPLKVTQVICSKQNANITIKPICPNCHVAMKAEKLTHCERCGQRLSWQNYEFAQVIITE